MMRLNDIISNIDAISLYIPESAYDISIMSLCHNSKHATPTCVFFCKKGALADGHIYAYDAYVNGARIFVAERPLGLPDDAAVIITSSSSDALNRLAVQFYDDPSKDLKIIGITGTKGKTTVAIGAYNTALFCGMSVGYIGTNGIYYNGKVFETANTTPDALELQKALREMKNDGVETVMLEISSQALWQERTYGLKFEMCVFTNLYRDHIGGCEHPTFEHYRDSKRRLFSDYHAKDVIINADSPDSEYMAEDIDRKKIITTSAAGNTSCSLYASNLSKIKKGGIPGISFKLHLKDENNTSKDIFLPMPGLYNAENALLISAICLALGLKLDVIADKLASLSIPGRFEAVILSSKPNSLFVIDYAHNGASLKAVIKALREYAPQRIICLFGSVGGRTFERRRELGEVAGKHADVLIITSDNPNRESPLKIISEIRDAVGETDKPIYEIPDRAEAVKKAYEIAEDGDFVLFAGKGHECYQLIGGVRVPFSERKTLELADLDAQILIK